MTIVRTPESQADQLEKLIGNPDQLQEMMEARVLAILRDVEFTARNGTVLLRRIREKELYRIAGWPTWEAFSRHFCPDDPSRFDLLISALEVLEHRGDPRDFTQTEAARIVNAANATTGAVLPEGRPKKLADSASLSQRERAKENGVSHDTQKKLDALARQRPDLLDEVRAGRMSVNAAAIAAGIVRESHLATLKRHWNKATVDERAAFLDHIKEA